MIFSKEFVRKSQSVGPWRVHVPTVEKVGLTPIISGLPIIDHVKIGLEENVEVIPLRGEIELSIWLDGQSEEVFSEVVPVPRIEPGRIKIVTFNGPDLFSRTLVDNFGASPLVVVLKFEYQGETYQITRHLITTKDLNWYWRSSNETQLPLFVDPNFDEAQRFDPASGKTLSNDHEKAHLISKLLDRKVDRPSRMSSRSSSDGVSPCDFQSLFSADGGNQLNASLLWASIAENWGLSPVIILGSYEVFHGAWADSSSSQVMVWRDVDSICEEISSGRLLIFRWSRKGLKRAIPLDLKYAHVSGMVSIREARTHGIEPLDVEQGFEELFTKRADFLSRGDKPLWFEPLLSESSRMITSPDLNPFDSNGKKGAYGGVDEMSTTKPDVPFRLIFPRSIPQLGLSAEDLEKLAGATDVAAFEHVEQVISDLIEEYGPLPNSALFEYLAVTTGLSADYIKEKFGRNIDALIPEGQQFDTYAEDFLWPEGMEPDSWRGYRSCQIVPEDEASLIFHFAIDELVNAVVAGHPGRPIDETSLLRRALAEIGFAKMAYQCNARLSFVLDVAVANGRLTKDYDDLYGLA